MNQEKIGKFIATKRKENNLTQKELAEKLGVTDRAISNWENGKNMPDLSLFEPLSKILNITINDLMSGEEIEDKNYKTTFEKNVVNVVSNIDKKQKKNKILIIILLSILSVILILYILVIIYNTYELPVKYDNRIMTCEIDEQNIKYNIKGLSVLNNNYIKKEFNNETIIFIHNTINLYNKRRSNYEYYHSLTRLLEGKEIVFSSFHEIEINTNNVKVYYTDINPKRINNDNIKEIINSSYLMCSNNK